MPSSSIRVQALRVPRKAGFKIASFAMPMTAAADVALAGLSWPEIGKNPLEMVFVLSVFATAAIGVALVHYHRAAHRLQAQREALAAIDNAGVPEFDQFLATWQALQRRRAAAKFFDFQFGLPTSHDLALLQSAIPHMLSEPVASKVYRRHLQGEIAARYS